MPSSGPWVHRAALNMLPRLTGARLQLAMLAERPLSRTCVIIASRISQLSHWPGCISSRQQQQHHQLHRELQPSNWQSWLASYCDMAGRQADMPSLEGSGAVKSRSQRGWRTGCSQLLSSDTAEHNASQGWLCACLVPVLRVPAQSTSEQGRRMWQRQSRDCSLQWSCLCLNSSA